MKNKFSKILGVGLVIAVLASLLVVSTPASAGNMAWSKDSAPVVVSNIDVVALATASNGTTGYAVATDNKTYKTVDGGNTWTATGFAGGVATRVSVAPDVADGSVVAVITATAAFISTNGGTSFTQMSGFTGTTIRDISISPALGTSRSIAIATDNSCWIFSSGTEFGGSSWVNAMTNDTTNVNAGVVLGVAFSPNFLQDRTLVVVTTNTINYYNVATQLWNDGYAVYGMTGNGIAITTGAAVDIALAPSFMAFDAGLRSVYVASTTGLYRNGVQLTAVSMYSVALNAAGDTLVAGAAGSNLVYSYASPATALGTSITQSTKSPGYATNSNVSVAYFGTSIGAATVGNESAFALSSDGKAFNDVAFIDTTATFVDFAVNADASKYYVVSYNAGTAVSSLWRKSTVWERVYKAAGAGYVIRPVLSNFDAIFFVQTGTQNIMYSNDAGQASWQPRVAYAPIADFAAETVSNLYILSATGGVQKATDGGYLWTPSGTISVGANGSITLLSAGNLLVAGASGVSYTADAGATWVSPILALANAKKAVADKLATGGVITAITDTGIYKYTIGTSVAFGAAAVTTTGTPNGIVISGGVTYVMTSAKTYRSPVTSLTWGNVDSVGLVGLATGKAGVLYTMNTGVTPNEIDVFTEIFAAAGPAYAGPADKFVVPINMETGAANNVVFQWTGLANASPVTTTYNLQVALDAAFTQVVKDIPSIAGGLAIVGSTASGNLQFPFQADTTYYWRVRADAAFDSPWSAAPYRSFKIDTLAPVNLISPTSGANNVGVQPTFAWSAAAGATGYEIVVSDDPTFAIITYSRTTTLPVFASDEQLAYSTVYYWRVRPTGPTYPAAGTAYKVGVFTTAARPTTPEPPITITNTSTTVTVQIPPSKDVIPAYLLWIIIGIGAILVIALIVLIVRTRRVS